MRKLTGVRAFEPEIFKQMLLDVDRLTVGQIVDAMFRVVWCS